MARIVDTKIWKLNKTALFSTERYLYLFYVLKGSMQAKIGPSLKKVNRGELLIANQHCLCQCSALEECIVQLIQIDAQKAAVYYPQIKDMVFKADTLRFRNREDPFTSGRDIIFLSDCINLLKEDYDDSKTLSRQSEYILSLLCLEYTVFNNQSDQYSYISEEKKERLLKVLSYLQENLEDKVTLKKAADIAGITPQHLSTLWKEYFNLSFIEYVTKIRLEASESLLLLSDYTVTDIIMSCGFSDRKYFYRCFKEVYGCTPTQWKKQWQNSQWESETLNEIEVQSLLSEVIKHEGLHEKPMDSVMAQKYFQLKRMKKAGLLKSEMMIALDLSETILMDKTDVQPLTFFGYDLLAKFTAENQLNLRIIIPIEKKSSESITTDYILIGYFLVLQSMLRFGKLCLTDWQVDLVLEDVSVYPKAEEVRQWMLNAGVSNVTILF